MNNYIYGYGKMWGFNDVDKYGCNGSCMGGKIGCGADTYHNNRLLGSPERPVLFTDIKRICCNGKDVDVLISDTEFFDRLRFDCTYCRPFFARICTCIEFGDTRPVFISDNKCDRILPLETSRNGYIIHADQIQPYANDGCLLRMTACYDDCNDHVTISTYYKRHAKCDCKSKSYSDCECDGIEDAPHI